MAFDGIVTAAVARELDERCKMGKIEKIYQPDKDELIFHIHTPSCNLKLYLSSNPNHPGAYLIPTSPLNPQDPGSFCMLLRKHLLGGRVTSIKQKDTERILEIFLETRDEMGFQTNKKMVIEIMGKHSNICLVDLTRDRIIDTIKRVPLDVSRERQLLPGLQYEYPPSQGKVPFDTLSPQILDRLSTGDVTSTFILETIQGISPIVAQEISELDDGAARIDWFRALMENLDSNCLSPRVFLDQDDAPTDFHVIPLSRYDRTPAIAFDTVSEAIDYYYTNRISTDRLRQKSQGLRKSVASAIKKNLLKQKRINEDLELAAESEIFRLYGELLTANLHVMKPEAATVELTNYYNGGKITIPLDKRLSPVQNAQAYYRKYTKSKRTIQEKSRMLSETQSENEYLQSVMAFLEITRDPTTIDSIRDELVETGYLRSNKAASTKKKGRFIPLRYTTCDGFTVLVGRNNKENDEITFHVGQRNDLWFHAKDYHGAHVVLVLDGKEPTLAAIGDAAGIAAFHSKGRGADKIPVDYTRIRFVKKPQGSQPGKCIYTDQQTLYVKPQVPKSTVSS